MGWDCEAGFLLSHHLEQRTGRSLGKEVRGLPYGDTREAKNASPKFSEETQNEKTQSKTR